ncbi:MAG TPA: hypothetical protein VF609_02665, partial [Flavisolibacter sp.]
KTAEPLNDEPEMKTLLVPIALFISSILFAQDVPIEGQKRIFFPYPMDKSWQTSIGFTSTTMPRDITEEAHFRIPAGDFHVLKRLGKKLYLDSRVNLQVVQNLVTLGPRLPIKLSNRLSMALGSDVGFWFGRINIASIQTRGQGFQNYPNISFGYRFNKQVLLTVRAESIMNFGIKTKAAETTVASDYRLFSGSAYSVILEQPFAGSKSMTLGFRALYTDYFWQTWTLFESYERNLFFPQIIVGLIL